MLHNLGDSEEPDKMQTRKSEAVGDVELCVHSHTHAVQLGTLGMPV